jgi:sec-independent protein translocase protein TatA
MGELFQPTHLLIIGVIVFIFFGGKKLPDLGRGLGEGLRGFKEGLKEVTSEVSKSEPTENAPPQIDGILS